MKFKIVDLVSKRILGFATSKGEADREFVRLQKEHPTRKLWLKMESK
jgi:hypothetical protein